MGQNSKESGGGEEGRIIARVYGGRGLVKIDCGPGQMGDRGTADSPVLPVREAGTVETMIFERIVLGCWRLVVEVWTVKRGEEPESEVGVGPGWVMVVCQQTCWNCLAWCEPPTW